MPYVVNIDVLKCFTMLVAEMFEIVLVHKYYITESSKYEDIRIISE
jgi:hypothetical protein